MPYQQIPLHYRRFFRSAASPKFEAFDRPQAFVAWIDILGVQRMQHADIVRAVRDACEIAAECTSIGGIQSIGTPPYDILVGTPQSVAQYVLIGDALLIVEKDQPETPAAAILGFIDRVCLASRILHESGYIHKGVITRGAIFCDRIDDASIITGAGAVRAYQLESGLDAAGLFYDQEVANFIAQRGPQIQRRNWYEPFAGLANWNAATMAPNLVGTIFSQYSGWELWEQAIAGGDTNFSKVANARVLIQSLRAARGLP